MSEIPVDKADRNAVEVEKQITKRLLIETIGSIVVVIIYIAFAFLRDRDPGIVSLDGSASDWE